MSDEKAKAKAIELVKKYYDNCTLMSKYLLAEYRYDYKRINYAKKAAHINVEEMLSLGILVGSDLSDDFYLFWENVKSEINLLQAAFLPLHTTPAQENNHQLNKFHPTPTENTGDKPVLVAP